MSKRVPIATGETTRRDIYIECLIENSRSLLTNATLLENQPTTYGILRDMRSNIGSALSSLHRLKTELEREEATRR